MILTYEYRIKPSPEQEAMMLHWLELLRRHWNYALGQRLDWLNRTRCQIDRCSIKSEPIGNIPERPNYHYQAGELKQTKILFPEYKDIYAQVQQQNLMRLDKAWQRWLKPDKTGKRGGRPKFKKSGELRSFTFPQTNSEKAGAHIIDNSLKLSKIGFMPVVVHRPIPDGFTPKTCTLIKKADGWYASIVIEDASVPSPLPLDAVKSAIGIDVGLKEFLVDSEGDAVPIQQYYRKAQSKLGRAQRELSHKVKGSANYQKLACKIACLHQFVARVRKEFHYQVAHKLCEKYDLIGLEDLNIKGLAKTRLAKSILDAAWGQFSRVLEAVAVKRGNWIVKVNPYGTSQMCSGCGKNVPKALSVRTHECPHCGTVLDRDHNAAINIKNLALNAVGLAVSACGSLEVTQLVKQESLSVKKRSSRYIARLA